MIERQFALILVVAGAAMPPIVTYIVVKRRRSVGAAVLTLLGLGLAESFGFWAIVATVANVIDRSGGYSTWGGEATLGVYILAAGLFLWCAVWSVVASIAAAIISRREDAT